MIADPTLVDLARRCSLFTAALGFAPLDTRGKPAPPEEQTVRMWLDTWRGVDDVVTGMIRQGDMLHLPNVDARRPGGPDFRGKRC